MQHGCLALETKIKTSSTVRWLNCCALFYFVMSLQYISILELLGSVDLMSRNLPYRKYRPEVHVHKNALIWSENCTFCFCCTLRRWSSWLCFYVPELQVEVRDHQHPGSGREATSPHVVVEIHSPAPAEGEVLQRLLQDKDHQQEALRGASQAARGGARPNLS